MGRSRKTASRGRALPRSGITPSGSPFPQNSPNSDSSPFQNVQVARAPSELPVSLLQYMSQPETLLERPIKRRRFGDRLSDPSLVSELEFVVVCKSVWDIEFPGSHSSFDTPLERTDVPTIVRWKKTGEPEHLQFLDDRTGDPIFLAQIPYDPPHFEDVLVALQVDRDHKKWANGQGKLWTEFGLALISKGGFDVLQITFIIKWNVTTSPGGIWTAKRTTNALSLVLNKYFPDTSVNKAEKWTPQDFYSSLHIPAKDTDVSAIQIPGSETNLFPFQKRAVAWLLQKEGVELSPHGITERALAKNTSLPLSFIPSRDANHRPCYVSHLFGLVTMDVAPFQVLERNLKGGILAEEMGLGKTVEIISLVSLHRRPAELMREIFDPLSGTYIRPTPATLIIAPPSIMQQWISEVNKHAPHLKVLQYDGIKGHKDTEQSVLLEQLATSDIVVTTYSVLAAEIYFTQLNGQKILRNESKYPRPKSPLMQLSWFRVCIDEAQMIDSGVSKAAIVARMIPRTNAWCITGTPVRKNVNDLLGLLVFLQYHPYASNSRIWSALISSHKHNFQRLFNTLAMRHSKQSVRDELKLPAQRRYVITMPFTPIEEQHYQELFNQMCESAGLDTQGSPLADTWDPDSVSEVMRTWLVRLRQTALHPEVGGRNRRALGQKDGPLRTVDQVLDVMMEQTDVAIRTDQRTALTLKLKRGQLFENSPRVREALEIWTEAVAEAAEIVQECRDQLQQEVEKSQAEEKLDSASRHVETGEDSSDEQEEVDPSSRLGVIRNRLRGGLEIQHMAVFFQANAYFQIKSNENMTQPDSPEFQDLEKLETEGYEKAKILRQEILQEMYRKADRLMKKVSKRATAQSFVQIPEFPTNPPSGGIESRRLIEELDLLAAALDNQANVIDEWREKTIQFLLRPLVDEDHEGVELTGEEYEESTKTQDEVMVFVQALRAIIADRHDALTGQENALVAYEVKATLKLAKNGEGPSPEKTIELLKSRQNIKPTKEMGSIRGIVAEFRALATSLRTDAESGSFRAQNELSIVETQLSATQKQLSGQTKATSALEKEIDSFTSVMNARLEYYRQLQQVSDMVAPYEGPNNDRVHAKMKEDEEKISRKIAALKSKRRYLDHLRLEALNPQDHRICVICKEPFDIGALTVCGHQYCKECIGLWWSAHHNCPVCKRKLLQVDLHDITYKPQELSIEAEEAHDSPQQRASPVSESRKSAIYSQISKTKLAEIKNIELDGPSFTTKVDTLARHLIWLRESDPGAKSIIYSQFKDFLNVLAMAFKRFRIGFSSIDKADGIERFKQDPSVECFLLHARAHSSGLNLVNASHVFLCEPLLNTALELQAIARVDRIGQHQETNVWLYLVDGTVEESIHQLSVRRRMEHIGQNLAKGKGKARELSPADLIDTKLEEANSMELQQASLTGLLAKGGKGGEMVHKEDLWECLFGGIGQRRVVRTLENSDLMHDSDIGRELRAGAAEGRVVIDM